MAEFQIIPTYLLGDAIADNLIQQLKIHKIKKVYLFEQNIDKNAKVLKEIKNGLDFFKLKFHEEIINFEIIDESIFNHLLQCIKIGLPEALVVIGSETAINVAKLINFLLNNRKINSLTDFIQNTNCDVRFPLKIYCVLNDFTTGSENNFPGILKIKYQDKITQYAFNANSMPSVIYANVELFKHLGQEDLNLNLFAILIRLIEQFCAKNLNEWIKNYITGNVQTAIDLIENTNFDEDTKLKNLIWTNLIANSGINNFLAYGDWWLHILAYEISDVLNIKLATALLITYEKYFLVRIQNDPWFAKAIENLNEQIYGSRDCNEFIDHLNQMVNLLSLNDLKISNQSLLGDKKICDQICENVAHKLIGNKSKEEQEKMQAFLQAIIC